MQVGLQSTRIQAAAQLSKKRIGPHYSKTSLLNQMLELNIAGYGNDVAADALQRPSRETGPWDD